ncbi:DUF6252 family protein [Agriterribacter sp.]|uniref:DUF6252 family protein n=1 Tax=Agriterribacter sp. TaxID=2821509 RepID=UPI002CFABB8D|nr:DUF6252 family protein [Agriterribacter sp.]HRO45186.1 DUF6252 family protein [Agriterribacter sp.]HRQ17791.1 DUF6252 family protein [Agriterribacter sp.]
MKNVSNGLLIFGALFITLGCNKDGLTKATQKGANTFSCKVNGKVFKPFFVGGLFNSSPVLSARNNSQYNFSISAKNQETSQSVALENPYIQKTGIYKLYANHPNRGIYSGSTIEPGWYTTDSVHVGELTITRCDNLNHIYSGTFFFTAKDPNTGKTINVTDGRFDVKE